MVQTEFDAEDIGMLVLGILSAGVMVGIVSVQAFSYSMSDVLFSVGGGDITIAYLLSAATFVGIVLTNDNEELLALDGYDKLQESDIQDEYVYLIVASVAVLVAWILFPEVANFFQGSDALGSAYIAGMAAAQVALGWMY